MISILINSSNYHYANANLDSEYLEMVSGIKVKVMKSGIDYLSQVVDHILKDKIEDLKLDGDNV